MFQPGRRLCQSESVLSLPDSSVASVKCSGLPNLATLLSGKLKTDADWMGHHPGWNTTADGEKRQAREVVELYRVLFSHPAVEAITWWDFSDLHAWQGAPAGLVRKDMSPKPAYEELMKLVKGTWWTGERKLTTDAAGRADYEVGTIALGSLQSHRWQHKYRQGRWPLYRFGARLYRRKFTDVTVDYYWPHQTIGTILFENNILYRMWKSD